MANLGGGSQSLPTEFDIGPRPTLNGEQAVIQDRSGQIIGNAISDFGSNIEQIGIKIADEQDRLQMAQARSAYLQADVAAREAVKSSTDWQNAVPTYQKTMQQAQQKALGMVKNNINRTALQLDLQNDYVNGSAQVFNIANGMRQNANQATLYSTLDANRQAALLAPDDGTRTKLIDSSLDTINAAQQARTITPVQAEEIRKNYTASLDKGFIEMQPPQKQIDIINASLKPHEGRLPGDYIQPDERYNMLQRAEAKQKADNSGAVADMRSHIASLDASYHAGLPVPDSYKLTAAQIEAVMPGQGQFFYDSLMRAQRVGSTVKNVNQMSWDQLDEVKSQFDVKQAGEATDDKLMGKAEVWQAIEASKTQRKADPAKFAVDNSIGGYKQLDFSDQNSMLTSLQNRAANQVAVSKQVGVATPIVSPDEAKAFNSMLMSQRPEDRAKLIGSINKGLHNSDAYQSLMRQIMPQSPVTAIVGSRIGLNNPAQPPTWFDHTQLPPQETAQMILHGEELLTGKSEEKGGYKKTLPMPEDGGALGMRYRFNDEVGDMFRSRPDTADATFAAYKAAYAAIAAEKGDVSGQFNRSISKQAIAMAVGNQVSWQGHNVAIPDGMKPDSFKSYVNAAVEATVKAAGGPGDWQDRIKGYELREIGAVGSGRYQLVNGNAPLIRPDGKGTFVIDLRQQYGQR